MKTPERTRRRQFIRFLLGLALLIFAGYAIGLRSTGMPEDNLVFVLGESRLPSGGPMALRVIAYEAGGGNNLAITGVDVDLEREDSREVLARLLPKGGVVDLNLDLPDWAPGPARIMVRVDTTSGSRKLAAQVELTAPGAAQKHLLRLDRPSEELLSPARVESQPSPQSRDLGGDGPAAPASFQVFPLGGSPTLSFDSRILVRVADRAGEALQGKLLAFGKLAGRTDGDGLATVVVPADTGGPLSLRFEGPSGVLTGRLDLAFAETPFDLAVRPRRVAAGSTLEAQVRSSAQMGQLYFDLWHQGGWCGSAQAALEGGRAAAVLKVPDQVEGPLVVRVRSDSEGRDKQVRSAVVWVGRKEVPAVSLVFAQLVQLTPDGTFWAETRHLLTGGRGSLMALLTRVKGPQGALPVLADSRYSKVELPSASSTSRSTISLFALILSGAASFLFLLVLAWLLLSGRREKPQGWRLIFIGALLLGLSGGWIWLYLNST